MKNKLLSILLVMLLTAVLALTINAMSGSGTENDPYLIETKNDFASIQSNLSAHYKLMNDLELSSQSGAIIEAEFKGVFDGNGHKIELNITAPTNNSSDTLDALFALSSGVIKNLTVTGSVTGSNKVAGIVAKLISSGNIDNCVNYATIYGRKNVGGIAGVLFDTATITNCKNYGSIGGQSINKGVDLGGIVGCVWYTTGSHTSIINCYNAGTINGNGSNCGGICGFFYSGKIESCFNTGSIDSTDPASRGSIFGCSDMNGTHTITGYFSTTDDKYIGTANGSVTMNGLMLESDGVAIYLGNGSGIRGEFHINKSAFEAFKSLLGDTELEYGAVVSTKNVVSLLGGNLLSQEAKDNELVVYAPAFANGEIKYSYADEAKGDSYHSFRVALTNFPDNEESYNKEFVILGYLKTIDKDGNEGLCLVNTVESERLASAVGETGINAISIVRVAQATIDDGDFNGNIEALNALNHIIGFKNYETKIEIDSTVGYGHKNATFTKSKSSDDTVVFKISNTDSEEFSAYILSLIDNEYERIFENQINDNSFYTYKKGNTLINAVYSSKDSIATITRETLTALPDNTSVPSYTKKNDPSITQIKLADNVNIKEGMSYVLHLSDGTFFIIDGGWCYDDYLEADKLYNTLKALAGEGNDIVIAGWIFTHCHGDHIGTFNYFVEKYHDSVTINQLLYNFPNDDDIASSGSSYMLDSSKQRYSYFRQMIATYLTDTEIVKIHSGYKFYYADLEVEILQTLEDLYPSTVANYDFNSSSTLFTLKIGGQKMLFLGDVSDVGANHLNNTYGSALKSDFVQIAHHGLNNGGSIKSIYMNADPKYVFYPAPLDWYESNSGASANFYISTESKTVKQIFVSGISTFKLMLPYDGSLFNGDKVPGLDVPEIDDDRVEVERPSESVIVPDAYFDLDLSGDAPADAKGNATVTTTGGEITQTTVTHGGEEKTATVYTGDRYKEKYYLTVDFNQINTEADWADFIMGSTTFEIFLRLDKLPGQTVGLITSCNGGGVTLYLRKQAGGQLNFQIGSTNSNANSDAGAGRGNYSAAVSMNGDAPIATANDLLHIVGSYDSNTNMMKLYINGILVAEADFGEGNMKLGSQNDCVLGIGYNPQYSSEEISSYANFELFEARVYDVALTDEQVAQQYWNCIDNLLVTEE